MDTNQNTEVWQVAPDLRGRPYAFDDPKKLQDVIISYLKWVSENPLYEARAFSSGLTVNVPKKRYPSAEGCAIFCGVTSRTWRNWGGKDHHLKEVIDWAESVFRQMKMEGAAANLFHPQIVARDLGLKDKQEIDTNMSVTVVDTFEAGDE